MVRTVLKLYLSFNRLTNEINIPNLLILRKTAHSTVFDVLT